MRSKNSSQLDKSKHTVSKIWRIYAIPWRAQFYHSLIINNQIIKIFQFTVMTSVWPLDQSLIIACGRYFSFVQQMIALK